MDYIKQLNAFARLSIEKALPTTVQTVYLRLFLVNNSAGWAEWFSVTDFRLMFEAGIGSKNTIYAARNTLKQKGFIDFVSKGTTKPVKYKLINLYSSEISSQSSSIIEPNTEPNIELNSEPKDEPITEPNTELNSEHLYRHKNIKEKIDICASPELSAALSDFYDMRKKIKKPMTDRAKKLLLDRLHVLAKDDATRIAILNQSIMNNWQGVFPLKDNVVYFGDSKVVPMPEVDYEEKKRREAAIAKKRDDEVAAIVRRQILGESS
jgi:hypothetical protein